MAAAEIGLAGKYKIKLQDPHYSQGVLTTEKGGIVQGKDFSVQAKIIRYTKTQVEGQEVHKIEASGDILLLLNKTPFTGDQVEIDFLTHTITIENGYSAIKPWFVGGKKIIIRDDGSGVMEDGYITTSENEQNEWKAQARHVEISTDSTLKTHNMVFYFVKLPFFWIPTLSLQLKSETSFPLSIRYRYGGKAGPRIGISYDLIRHPLFKGQAILDIGLTRGIGGGFVGRYKNPNSIESLYTYNYVAKDLTKDTRRHPLRYRFQGEYKNSYFDENLDLRLTYDKISDAGMRYQYVNKTLESTNILPTQALFSHKNTNWVSTFNTKVRVNGFQTIKQELPLFTYNMRPLQLSSLYPTYLPILDTRLSAGYLDYLYSHQSQHVHNFHATRVDLSQLLYKRYAAGPLIITPHLGYRVIAYNNSPQHKARLQALGKAGFESHVRLTRPLEYGGVHALEPYVDYQYITTPTVKPQKHYLFDLQDGWARLNTFKLGMRNSLFKPDDTDSPFMKRYFFDLYTRAFINTKTLPTFMPKVYLDSKIAPTPYTAYIVECGYDIRHHLLDHLNVRGDFTVSEDIAFALEWRHRSPYAWRKVDADNFILDSFRREKSLRRSELSDRRNTFLTRFFFHLTSSLSLELHTRHGWRRAHQPSYTEYGLELATLFYGALEVSFSYDHSILKKKHENRFQFNFSIGSRRSASDVKFKKFGQGNYDN